MIRKWFASFLSLFAFGPSLAETQKANRLALADHLEQNVTDDKYDHQWFMNSEGKGCALGHAAAARIGGMMFDPDGNTVPITEAVEPETYNGSPSYNAHTASMSANRVFGDGVYVAVFHADNRFTREQAANALRSFEPLAA